MKFFSTYRPLKYNTFQLCSFSPIDKKQQGKTKAKTQCGRCGNSEVDLFFFEEKTSARLSLAGLLAAFFGKLIKFKKSMRETTVALIDPFTFLSASDTTDFSMQIRISR